MLDLCRPLTAQNMPSVAVFTAVWLLAATVIAQTTSPASSTKQAATATITAVSDCHPHGTTQCVFLGMDMIDGMLTSIDIVWWVRPSTRF
jgi:hypothetical protein